jgi:hypothetical protein
MPKAHPKTKFICRHCSCPFSVPPWRARMEPQFCNRSCRWNHFRSLAAARFAALHATGEGCWPWQGPLDADGYGLFPHANRTVRAHRFSFTLHRGVIPAGMHVLHACDNPRCVRPDHLFLGTNQANVDDMIRKGRQARGADIHTAKVNEATVKEIRSRYAARRANLRALAQEFGIGYAGLCDIVYRRSWKHV